MIPPTFHIGDEVLIIGPTITGCELHTGERFTIEQVDHDKYSGYGLPYYPASSLQLVNKKPLSPMQITYNYKPDNCKHGTFQVSCPCGRKAEIDPKLDDELKIGDWVAHDDIIFQIADISGGEPYYLHRSGKTFEKWYHPSALRKLTPEEIKQHMAPTKEDLDQIEEKFKMDRRLSAIEKRLDFVEKFQREQAEYRRGMLWVAGP
jgi:hypothetical protein